MKVEDIFKSLNELAELHEKRNSLKSRRDGLINGLFDEYQRKIKDAINEAHDVSIFPVTGRIAALEESIKQAVVSHGATVDGSYLKGIKYTGKVTYNSSRLDGYMVDHPEIKAFRKQGDDYCVIKKK